MRQFYLASKLIGVFQILVIVYFVAVKIWRTSVHSKWNRVGMGLWVNASCMPLQGLCDLKSEWGCNPIYKVYSQRGSSIKYATLCLGEGMKAGRRIDGNKCANRIVV